MLRCALPVGVIAVMAAAAVAAEPVAIPPAPGVANPRVTTDRSIDCSTVNSILAGLIRDGMSDEQKVVAVFNWVRRVFVHADGPRFCAFDFHTMVNVLGNGSCLRQTTPMSLLVGRLGYESRSWVHDGHHMLEVKYSGAWHCFDPHMTFYVYDRSQPRQIAGIEQLRADLTLASDAVKEGRACPGYLLCGDNPKYFGPGGKWVLDKGWPKMKVEEPFGRIRLARGMTYVRTWTPGEHYFKDQWSRNCGVFHTCSFRADQKDVVNWPLLEPHVAKCGEAGKQYPAGKHWAAGRLEYVPDLTSDSYRDALVSEKNVKPTPEGLVAIDPAKPSEVVFDVGVPYVVTALNAQLHAVASLATSIDGGRTWQEVGLMNNDVGLSEGFSLDPVNGSFDGCLVKLSWTGKQPMRKIALTTHFQLNPAALPYLAPGRNVVKVDAAVFSRPLTVKWTYAEGPKWDQPKSAEQTFDKPATFTIDVEEKSGKYPRNVELSLSIAP